MCVSKWLWLCVRERLTRCIRQQIAFLLNVLNV